MNLDRAVFFLPHAQFFAVLPENRTNKPAPSLAATDAHFFRRRGGFFVAGWELCYNTPLILPKATPLDSGKCSALRFSHFKKATGQERKAREDSQDFGAAQCADHGEVRHTPAPPEDFERRYPSSRPASILGRELA